MIEIGDLSKDDVYSVMSELLYTINYGWFMIEDMIRNKHPELLGSEEYRRLNEDVGSYEAKRLSKALCVLGDTIDGLISLLRHSHWAVFENIEVEKLTGRSFRMRTSDCSAQKAAKKWGMEYYTCGPVSFPLRSGFFKAANQNAKVERIFTPPDARPESIPENVSCEWLISIE
jgi:hypothetical protein